MSTCEQCEKQSKRNANGKPHGYLVKLDACRIFKGAAPRGYEEQDYQCLKCQTKMTHSTNKNDAAWTLWLG